MKKEKPTTKMCKHCKTEIPYGAKVCPQCRKKQGASGCLIIIIVIIALGLIGSCFGGGKNNDVKPVSTTEAITKSSVETSSVKETASSENTSASTEKSEFGVGESAEQKNVIVTLNNVTESDGTDFIKPAEGNVFVLAEFIIENNSDKELNISSLLSFEAYQDGYSTSTSLSALTAKEGMEQLDGTVAAGKKMKGVVGYELPSDFSELEINVQLDVWSNKKITFLYKK